MTNVTNILKSRYIPFTMFSKAEEICNAVKQDILNIESVTAMEHLMGVLSARQPYFCSSARILSTLSEAEYMEVQLEPHTWEHPSIDLQNFHLLLREVMAFEELLLNVRVALNNQLK